MKLEEITKRVKILKSLQQKAYAPYSNYRVAALLETKENKLYAGVNIENSIYRATHAEKLALDIAVMNGEREFKSIIILSTFGKKYLEYSKIGVPCGQCRQDLAEFCDKDFEIIVEDGLNFKSMTLDEILPRMFKLK